MTKTEIIANLAAALAAAQGQIKGALKDSANPFFRSTYADLASVWDACRAPLAANGLSVVQLPAYADGFVTVTTMLLHASGEWISGDLSSPLKEQTPQAIGSAITYLRRYSLSALVGVAPEEDDGEAAMGRGPGKGGKMRIVDVPPAVVGPADVDPAAQLAAMKKQQAARGEREVRRTENDAAHNLATGEVPIDRLPDPIKIAASLIAECAKGFASKERAADWRAACAPTANALPKELKAKVRAAFDAAQIGGAA